EFKSESLDIKLIAGSAFGKTSGLKAHSPMIFMLMTAFTKGSFTYEKENHEHAIYIVKGQLVISGQVYSESQMLVYKAGSGIEVEHSHDAVFVLIGGEVFPEPRHIW